MSKNDENSNEDNYQLDEMLIMEVMKDLKSMRNMCQKWFSTPNMQHLLSVDDLPCLSSTHI